MVDTEFTDLPAADLPLVGDEVLALVQDGVSRQVTSTSLALLASSVAYHPSLYVPAERYGARAGGSFDNTAALQEAVDEAMSIGAMGISLPLCEPGDHFYVEGRVYMKTVDMVGNGPNFTVFECVDPDAGFDFSYVDDILQNGGYSGHFSVWGGPGGGGSGIATRPLVIGKRVSARFSNIHSWYADPDEGCNLIIDCTQNSLLDTIWCVDAAVPLRFDHGASSNSLVKGEIASAYVSNIEFRATSPSPPNQFDYTNDNNISDTILEGSYESTQHMIHGTASAFNKFTNCYISVNGNAFGGALPTDMNEMILAEITESAQASFMFHNCRMNGSNVVDVGVATDAAGARIHWSGGAFGAMPLGMKGNVLVEAEPWFFGTVTDKYDLSGIVSVNPRHAFFCPIQAEYETTASVAIISKVIGDSGYRAYMTAQGVWLYSFDGVGSYDVAFGPLADGVVGVNAAALLRSGVGISSARPAAPITGSFWYDSQIGKPIWWNGTVWKDAAGTTV